MSTPDPFITLTSEPFEVRDGAEALRTVLSVSIPRSSATPHVILTFGEEVPPSKLALLAQDEVFLGNVCCVLTDRKVPVGTLEPRHPELAVVNQALHLVPETRFALWAAAHGWEDKEALDAMTLRRVLRELYTEAHLTFELPDGSLWGVRQVRLAELWARKYSRIYGGSVADAVAKEVVPRLRKDPAFLGTWAQEQATWDTLRGAIVCLREAPPPPVERWFRRAKLKPLVQA